MLIYQYYICNSVTLAVRMCVMASLLSPACTAFTAAILNFSHRFTNCPVSHQRYSKLLCSDCCSKSTLEQRNPMFLTTANINTVNGKL